MSGINAFFRDVLGASFANPRWSWGGVDHDHRRVFLRVWRDDIQQGDGRDWIQILRKSQTHSRPGWTERVRHIELIRTGYRAFGVMCEREHPQAGAISRFDDERLLVLGNVSEFGDSVRLDIDGTVSVGHLALRVGRATALAEDLQEIARAPIPQTTRTALMEARLGQGRYRRELLKRWNGACAVTGCTVQAALRASHCKPWRDCDDAERIDPDNGLPLVATLDALFDAGLVAFDDSGAMLVSPVLSQAERDMLGVPAPLVRPPGKKQLPYLRHHRERTFLSKTPGAAPTAIDPGENTR